jgi:hypothetical protein
MGQDLLPKDQNGISEISSLVSVPVYTFKHLNPKANTSNGIQTFLVVFRD